MSNDNQHIPSSYKPSPLGIIPEDWEVKRLGEITTKIGSGITPRGGQNVYVTNGRPFMRSQNVSNGRLLLDDIVYIDDSTHQKQISTEIKPYDVLLNITGASIGRCAVAEESIIGGNVNQHVCIIRLKNKNLSYYVCSFLLSHLGQKQVDSFQAGGNREGLNYDQISSFKICVPPLNEIDQITNILSLWDTAIAKQTALLEKLTLRKRGLMQQLLTGKKRLKGFEGSSFKMMSFDKIANTINVKAFQISKSDYQEKGKTPIVDQGQMFIAAYSDSDKIFTNVPFILFGDHTRIIKWIDFPCIIGADGVQAIKPKEEIDIKYLYYLLSNTELPNLGYSRHMSILKEKVFYVSTDIDEQKAIAECLSNADKEIEIQKQKLAAMQEQKKGLMQVLLTGKKRIKTTSL